MIKGMNAAIRFLSNFCKKLKVIKKVRFIAVSVSFLILAISFQSYAQDPSAAFVVELLGNSHQIRRGDARDTTPAALEDTLNTEDTLYIPGDERSQASLGFVVDGEMDYAGLILRTEPYHRTSEYRFPCRALGGFTIAWRPIDGGNRACGEGLRIERGNSDVYSELYPNHEESAQIIGLENKQNIGVQNPSNLSEN